MRERSELQQRENIGLQSDLTTLEKPLRFQPKEIRDGLIKAHKDEKNIEYLCNSGWLMIFSPSWFPATTYRVQPEPPKKKVTFEEIEEKFGCKIEIV